MNKPSDIISDDEIIRVHANANFGEMTPRQVVNEGVLKYSMGHSHGSVGKAIMEEHGLIRETMGYRSSLTAKGKKYMRAMFSRADFDHILELARND